MNELEKIAILKELNRITNCGVHGEALKVILELKDMVYKA